MDWKVDWKVNWKVDWNKIWKVDWNKIWKAVSTMETGAFAGCATDACMES